MERKVQHCKQCGREIYFDGICVSCRTENERNEILALSQEEIDAAIRKICDEIETTGKLDKEQHLFTKLVNYRDIDTTEIAKTAFGKQLYYPSEIYKNAPNDIIQAMIEMLRQDDLKTMLGANHILLCLAIHGGEDVFQAFMEFEKNSPKWREKVYVNPSVYATYGGWSYDSDGNALKTLVNLMEIDGRDPRLQFLELDGVIKAKYCPNCVMWSDDNFCRYSIDGESEVICKGEPYTTEDYMKDSGIEEMDSNSYILGDNPVPPRYAADWEGGSSVGGFAFWIQDCVIKHCPDCGKTMKYLAQIQWDTVLDGMEGNAYIEICKECKTIAVLHQQT